MRSITVVLLVLLGIVNAELWFGKGGVPREMDLNAKLTAQLAANQSTRLRNLQLDAEVRDLKEGLEMVEEKARYELGMVKPDEILIQLAAPKR